MTQTKIVWFISESLLVVKICILLLLLFTEITGQAWASTWRSTWWLIVIYLTKKQTNKTQLQGSNYKKMNKEAHQTKAKQNIRDVKFASGIKNINFDFYPYTENYILTEWRPTLFAIDALKPQGTLARIRRMLRCAFSPVLTWETHAGVISVHHVGSSQSFINQIQRFVVNDHLDTHKNKT